MNKLCVALLLLTLASVAWSATIEGRIIGGSPAAAGQFPHQVSLRSSANAHFCSGFIYNSRWVVSMAHCTSGRTTANTIAVVGAHTPTDGTSHAIVTIRNHPNYNANTKVNDISVLQTATEIVMNARVSPIPLGSVTVGVVDAVSSGWGFTSVSKWLRKPMSKDPFDHCRFHFSSPEAWPLSCVSSTHKH